jgi:hypothetical protein
MARSRRTITFAIATASSLLAILAIVFWILSYTNPTRSASLKIFGSRYALRSEHAAFA